MSKAGSATAGNMSKAGSATAGNMSKAGSAIGGSLSKGVMQQLVMSQKQSAAV